MANKHAGHIHLSSLFNKEEIQSCTATAVHNKAVNPTTGIQVRVNQIITPTSELYKHYRQQQDLDAKL